MRSLVIIFAITAVLFQNCGKGNSTDGSGTNGSLCILPGQIAPTVYVNESIVDPKYTLAFFQNQNVEMGISYSNNLKCGPSGDSYWLLPDNSKVHDLCVDLSPFTAQVGIYSAKWVMGSPACDTNPGAPLEIHFNVYAQCSFTEVAPNPESGVIISPPPCLSL